VPPIRHSNSISGFPLQGWRRSWCKFLSFVTGKISWERYLEPLRTPWRSEKLSPEVPRGRQQARRRFKDPPRVHMGCSRAKSGPHVEFWRPLGNPSGVPFDIKRGEGEVKRAPRRGKTMQKCCKVCKFEELSFFHEISKKAKKFVDES